MIEKLVRNFLRDSEDVRNVVAGRIYAGFAPAKTDGPYIVLRRMSHDRSYHLQNEAGVVASSLQIDCYDATATKTVELFELVRNRLSGYGGLVEFTDSSGEQQTAYLHSATIMRDDMQHFEPVDASDRWIHAYSADFRITHSQTVPSHL